MAFDDRNELGQIGEDMFTLRLDKMGTPYSFYGNRNSSHKIDLNVTINGIDYLVDVKTKRRRDKFADTGIDYPDYINYGRLSVELGIDVLIVFVDYFIGEILYQDFSILDEWDGYYPHNDFRYGVKKGITYFNLNKLITLDKLTNNEIVLLKNMEKSNYKFYATV